MDRKECMDHKGDIDQNCAMDPWEEASLKIQSVMEETPGEMGLTVLEIDGEGEIRLNEEKIMNLASVGKLFILGCLLEKCEKGEASLEDMILMEENDLAGGSGLMQYMKIGMKHCVYDLALLMVTVSDNTATNLLLKYLGGAGVIKKHLISRGILNSQVNRRIAMTEEDLAMGNFADGCSGDIAAYLKKIEKGEILHEAYLEVFHSIMGAQEYKNLFLKEMPLEEYYDEEMPKAVSAGSKTGFDGDTRADCGWIKAPDGRRFVYAAIGTGSGDTIYSDKNVAAKAMNRMGRIFYEGIINGERKR